MVKIDEEPGGGSASRDTQDSVGLVSLVPRDRTVWVIFLALCVVWGTTWIAIAVGVANVPALTFAGARFLISGSLLLIIGQLRKEPLGVALRQGPRLFGVGLIVIGITYAGLFWGMRHVPSSIAAVLNLALFPIFLLIIGVWRKEESFSRRKAVAVALGVCGISLMFRPTVGVVSLDYLLGAAAIVGGTLAYSYGSIANRPLLRVIGPITLSGCQNVTGGLALLVVGLAFEPIDQAIEGFAKLEVQVAFAFLVLFGSAFAFTAYMRVLRDWGPMRAGAYAYVSPVIALAIGVLIVGEALSLLDGIAVAVLLVASVIATVPFRGSKSRSGSDRGSR